MKFQLFLLFSLVSIFSAKSDTLEDIDFFKVGGNYYSYPYMNVAPPVQTPVPEGYKPFHMEHYGRHGSRWHIGDYNYNKPYEILNKAKNDGKLTPLGEEVFEVVKATREEFLKGRDGELSDKGAVQHQVIGRRMAENFPEIFTSETYIDAKSTVVIRCILSMLNGLKGIQTIVPDIRVKTDASAADMWYMNYWDSEQHAIKNNVDTTELKAFQKRHRNKGDYLKKLINDPSYARDSVGDGLFSPLFSLLVNAQSHYAQPWLVDKVFTVEEAREKWLGKNAKWFVESGNSRLTANHQPFSQRNLLMNMIESADTAMNSSNKSVNLRYGHDSVVLPLAALMELNDYGEEINDFEELASKGWHDYKVIPMGANIQMVFYKPDDKEATNSGKEILVKVLLNEEEVILPVESDSAPYYSWKKLRDYYIDKLK